MLDVWLLLSGVGKSDSELTQVHSSRVAANAVHPAVWLWFGRRPTGVAALGRWRIRLASVRLTERIRRRGELDRNHAAKYQGRERAVVEESASRRSRSPWLPHELHPVPRKRASKLDRYSSGLRSSANSRVHWTPLIIERSLENSTMKLRVNYHSTNHLVMPLPDPLGELPKRLAAARDHLVHVGLEEARERLAGDRARLDVLPGRVGRLVLGEDGAAGGREGRGGAVDEVGGGGEPAGGEKLERLARLEGDAVLAANEARISQPRARESKDVLSRSCKIANSRDWSPDGFSCARLDEEPGAQGRGRDHHRFQLGRTVRDDRVEQEHPRTESSQEGVIDMSPAPGVVNRVFLLGLAWWGNRE